MIKPSISIIIPTYNVAPYIRKCLNSVGAQSYKGKIECLVVDDCGPDDSIQIAEDFISSYKGNVEFRIIYREKNGGLSAARNSGTKEAKGDYLYYLDSDDWITESCIEDMVKCIEEHPETELVIGSSFVVFPHETSTPVWLNPEKGKIPEFTKDVIQIKELIMGYCKLPVCAWNKLVSRKIVFENNIYFREGLLNEDVLFDYYLAKYVKAMSICFVPSYYYLRRDDGINITISTKNDRYFIDIANEILDTMDEVCKEVHLLACLKMVHKRYVYTDDKVMHAYAKRTLWRIFSRSGMRIKMGIMALFLLPNKWNRKRRVFSNLFMFKIFRNGYMYQI